MKKVLMIAALLMMAGSFVLLAVDHPTSKGAGDKGRPELGDRKAPGEMGLGLYSRLNLTEEQKAKIQEIQKSRHEQLSALKQDTTLSAEQKREKMKQIMVTTQKQMDEVLTSEQKQQMEQLRAEMKERMKEHLQKRDKPGEKPVPEAK